VKDDRKNSTATEEIDILDYIMSDFGSFEVLGEGKNPDMAEEIRILDYAMLDFGFSEKT
jgi:hypothetical protein